MDALEIKHEFECDSRLQCRSCLSIGRKLAPLAQYTNIYMQITAGLMHPFLLTKSIEICWECHTLLRKVSLFQQKVKKAYKLLINNQNFLYGSLSNLASVTLNDTHHTVYMTKYDHQEIPNLAINYENIVKNYLVDKETLKSRNTIKNNKGNTRNQKLTENVNNVKEFDIIKFNECVNQNDENHSHTNVLKTELDIRKRNGPKMEPLEMFSVSIQTNNNVISCDINNSIAKNKYNKNIEDLTKLDISQENSEEDTYLENGFQVETPNLNKTYNVKTVSKSKKPKSRWATKRAAQNKKPKYEIVSTNFDEAFTRVLISNEDLEECMAKERTSDCHKSKKFKCETCILGFVDEKEWLKHNEIHHSYKLPGYTCEICKTRIVNKRHLVDHIIQHYNVHKCKYCQYICRNEETGILHTQSEHKTMFKCIKCGLMICNRREFFKHHKDWHEKYVCEHCGVRFKMRYCIKEHIRKKHSPFTCTPCNKTFARYNGLWLHNKLAHSPPAPPAYCVECDTEYKDIYRYKWHLCNSVKHSPKKRVSIPCPACEKTFTKRIYMTDHHNLVHLKLFRYRCEQCDKNFIRNAELVKHRRRKHEGILPPRNKMCFLCGRGFTTNKILRNHLRTHETNKNVAREDKLKLKRI